MNRQNVQLDIKKHGDGMILVIVSEKQELWKEWKREEQVRRTI